ncbi:MAG: hypothetical protein AAFX94_06510 [Myxococcota bacterium]
MAPGAADVGAAERERLGTVLSILDQVRAELTDAQLPEGADLAGVARRLATDGQLIPRIAKRS